MKSGFGWVEIDGTRYEHDIVIHKDRTVTKREKRLSKPLKKKYGHTPLSKKELEFLAKEEPESVVIGTGHNGGLSVTPGAMKVLNAYKLRVEPTPEALRLLERRKGYVAIIHVTC
jgi:hypothetical protein